MEKHIPADNRGKPGREILEAEPYLAFSSQDELQS